MVVKVKNSLKRLDMLKTTTHFKKYILRGERNTRYQIS